MTGRPASLAERFARLIRTLGPITVQQWMGEANAHYYAAADPLGREGDFITAPEISQMFGELIGAWCADLWIRAGSPEPCAWVEIGPGRGTLARDALAVMRRFELRPEVHLVEGSPALRARQAATLAPLGIAPVWHDDIDTLPADRQLIVIANEFLDALPIRQLVRSGGSWRERMVGHDGTRFLPLAGDRPMDAAVPDTLAEAPEGAVIETCPGAVAAVDAVARRLAVQGGAALFIDYGYLAPPGRSTLQALRAHAHVDPFAEPGTADLTALVDFAAMAAAASHAGARVSGVTGQGAFLRALGLDQRTEALAKARPARADELASARDRLAGDDQMGTLFKVMGLAAPGWPDGAALVAPH